MSVEHPAEISAPSQQLPFREATPRDNVLISPRQLTKAILEDEFSLTMDLPNDRLCPGVKGRYAYIRYLHKLIDTTDTLYLQDSYDPNRRVVGLDIGVGASCIYPLLGCAVRPNWKFFGTDIDEKSFTYAEGNVTENYMDDRICLYRNYPGYPLIPSAVVHHVTGLDYGIDFVMCNPPFYRSQEEIDEARSFKKYAPPSACTGSEVEMITDGGEAAFVSRLVRESAGLRSEVRWFTSLLGFYNNVEVVREELRRLEVTNWCLTELAPGGRDATKRWVISWSFGGDRPADVSQPRDV